MAEQNDLPLTVDLTPSWLGVVFVYMNVLESGRSGLDARRYAREELVRMARLADLWVGHAKAQEDGND